MHRVFEINEILLHILKDLESRRDVAMMARVCRTFHETSLDIVWREIWSLEPLLFCLPPDLLEVRVEHSSRFEPTMRISIAFCRSIVPEDWRRFDTYAYRVRAIRRDARLTNSSRTLVLHESVLNAFEAARPCDLHPLLPRLEDLEISMDTENACTRLLRLLMGSSLKRFKFVVFEDEISEREALSWVALLRQCHSLTELILSFPPFESVSEAIGVLLQDLRSLRILKATPIVITSKALPALQEIDVDISEQTVQTLSSQSETSHILPSLVAIDTTSDGLNTVQAFVSTIASCSVERIRSDVRITPTATDVRQYFSTIRRMCFAGKIQQLYLIVDPLRSAFDPPCTINPLDLEPLQDLSIILPNHLALDDTFIRDAASAWPEIRRFEIIGTWPRPRGITLAGLIPLAYNCPHLYELALVIDAIHLPPQRNPSGADSKCALTTFAVGNSDIQNEEIVATFLSDLFPWLSRIDSTDLEVNAESCHKWDKVHELVPLLAGVRREERERNYLLSAYFLRL